MPSPSHRHYPDPDDGGVLAAGGAPPGDAGQQQHVRHHHHRHHDGEPLPHDAPVHVGLGLHVHAAPPPDDHLPPLPPAATEPHPHHGVYPDVNNNNNVHHNQQHYQHQHQHEAYHGDPAAAAAGASTDGGAAEYQRQQHVGHGQQAPPPLPGAPFPIHHQHQNYDNTTAANHGHGYVQGQEGYGTEAVAAAGQQPQQQWDYTQQQTHTTTATDNNNHNGANMMYDPSNQHQVVHHHGAEGGVADPSQVQQHHQQQYPYHYPESQGQGQPPPALGQQEYGTHHQQQPQQQPYTHNGANEQGGGESAAAGVYNNHHYYPHGDTNTGAATAAVTMDGTYQTAQQQQQAAPYHRTQPQYYPHVEGEANHYQAYPASDNNMQQTQHYQYPQAHHAYAQHTDQHHPGAMSGIHALHAAATGGYTDGRGYSYHGTDAAAAAVAAGFEGGERGRRPQHHHTPVPSDEAWERKFQQLQQFYREFGHSDVPQTYKLNKPLGKWCGKQREHWKARQETGSSTLTDERVRKLETVDFKFYMGKGTHAKHHGLYMTERNIEEFNQRFRELVAFKAEHGHCRVPFADPRYNGLAQWCSRINKKFRSHRLTGPLAVSLTTDAPAETTANEMEDPNNDTAATDQNHSTGAAGDNDNTGEGRSTSTTRASPKEKELRILLERKRKLEDLGGFDFDFGFHRKEGVAAGAKSNQDRWDENFEALRQYKERVGNADVPSTYREGEDKKDATLAIWIAKQREMWRNKQKGKGRKLSDEREAKLVSLGFNFEIIDAKWETRYDELRRYHEKNGSANVVERRDTRSLYHWCTRQREAFHQFLEDNSGPMTNEHIAKLEELGFDWKYERTHKRLEAKKAKGAGRSEKTKQRLGRPKKKNTVAASSTVEESIAAVAEVATEAAVAAPIVEVDPTEIESVEAALRDAIQCYGSHVDDANGNKGGKPKTNANPDRWLSMFHQLIQYKKDHGHCRVPQLEKGYDGLGLWVKVQRDDYRNLVAKKQSPMSEWRLELLQKIGFTFDAANHTTFEARLEQLRLFKAEFGHTKVPQKFERNKALGKCK